MNQNSVLGIWIGFNCYNFTNSLTIMDKCVNVILHLLQIFIAIEFHVKSYPLYKIFTLK